MEEKVNSIKTTARIAGLLYLLLVPLGIFGMLFVGSMLVVPGNAAATASNIMASEGLFRLGMVSDAVVFLIEIVLTVLLYILLKPVNKLLSLVAAVFPAGNDHYSGNQSAELFFGIAAFEWRGGT